MKHSKNFLAFDLGASNGRGFVGKFDGEKLSIFELLRFEHTIISDTSRLCWDYEKIQQNIEKTFYLAAKNQIPLDSFGIDAWGVDYALLNTHGQLLEAPRSYRRMCSSQMEPVHAVISEKELFLRTGLVANPVDTLYQLYRMNLEQPSLLQEAQDFLMLPSYFSYYLTGEKNNEYTEVTTSMLYSIEQNTWDYNLLDRLQLPSQILGSIISPGTRAGTLNNSIAFETGYHHLPHVYVATEDTASAAISVTAGKNCAFCSSGTWSLVGIESEKPVLTDFARNNYFSNEGNLGNTFRPIQNINGMWIIQECKKDWDALGYSLTWDMITSAAASEPPFRSIIDVDDDLFFGTGNMIGRIQAYCQSTKQPVPESVGQIARCFYDSLSLRYKRSFHQCCTISKKALDVFNIIGGGSKNKFMNQLTADVLGVPVIAGPDEAAVIGNIIAQAIAFGEIQDLEEGRDLIRRSFSIETFYPQRSLANDETYHYYLSLIRKEL